MIESDPTGKVRTVLIADDELDARETLQRVVERFGFACISTANGPEALQALREHPAQVIVADHDMPGMDGVELLKLVATRHPHVSRILLTGRKDAETAVRAINVVQPFRFLGKPCRASELVAALHFAFDSSDAELENRRLASKVRRQEALLAHVRRRHPGLVEELETTLPPVQ